MNYRQLEIAARAYLPSWNEVYDLPGTCAAFEHAFSNFLHEFLLWTLSDFFTEPPPTSFALTYQVVLAGTAEFFCSRYDWTCQAGLTLTPTAAAAHGLVR